MTASLTTLAAANGLDRVDHVSLSKDGSDAQAGQYVFVVQGDPKNPAHLRAHMPTDQAVTTPVETSFRELAQIDQRQQLQQQNAQTLAQQQEAPTHGARTLGV
ncbi:XVIPCD domain-containing protein [Xanthomonas campestris]|nr:XVIPCD domain-containing protein [Xanthomonas campestris]